MSNVVNAENPSDHVRPPFDVHIPFRRTITREFLPQHWVVYDIAG